jgi:guanine deaminase
MSMQLYRASILHFLDAQDEAASNSSRSRSSETTQHAKSKEDHGPTYCYQYFEDGILAVSEGKVIELGNAPDILSKYPNADMLLDYSSRLIMPGFIDAHTHFPQVDVVASNGEQLLDWLNRYTFPAESLFKDKRHALETADFFIRELLRNGTTTAMVYGTVHKKSVDAFFEVSSKLNTRMICGKVLMDRHAPEFIRDTSETAYRESRELIETWHNCGRQLYAITPRFAITSSPEQLAEAGRLKQEFSDVYMQTHISESAEEVEKVMSLFPESENYLSVYRDNGLLTNKSVFAHGIHLHKDELSMLANNHSSICFCPTSNLFLGSGLLDYEALERAGVSVTIGTDIGAGTSFSMLRTLHEAYKICQLKNYHLDPLKSLYLATLGNAKALHLDDRIGSFLKGMEADFVVLDLEATPLMKRKIKNCPTLAERLFSLIILGDDRSVLATFVAGELSHLRDDQNLN